jgi:type IV secretory system conjugative DNA transfer VirD4/TraG family protein/uncharacterized protein DUF87
VPTSNLSPHLNLFQHLLGTSRSSTLINGIIIGLGLVLVGFIVLPIIKLVLDIMDFDRLRDQRFVFLELTPPAYSTKSPLATAELFSVVHGLCSLRSRKHGLLRRKCVMSFEVVSTRHDGIRYLVRLSEDKLSSFQQLTASYLPDTRFKLVDDYLLSPEFTNRRYMSLSEFKQSGHFAYPLAAKETLSQHDPIAYITGSMTKLEANELIAFQVVVSPASRLEASKIRGKLLSSQDIKKRHKFWQFPFILIFKLIRLVLAAFWAIMETIGEAANGTYHAPKSYSQQNYEPKRRTVEAQRLVDDMHAKLRQPLFQTDIRALVAVTETHHAQERAEGLVSSLASFDVPDYQGFSTRGNFPTKWRTKYRLLKFQKRLPSMITSSSNVLAASEVSDLYHFPYGSTTQTENIMKSLSRTLPASLSLKNDTQLDVLLGENHHHGQTTPIGLTIAERERHVYIVGGTGNGKTTVLLYGIVQDINNGKAVAIIDPHGDLAESVLRHIPEERINDVIYINPIDVSHPIGLNLLELQPSVSGDELLIEKDLVTEAIISIFHKIFSDDDSGGHRVEYILRNAIQTALTLEGSTLFTIFDLLNDPNFRHSVVKNLQDRNLKNFWINEFGKAGSYQKVKMSAGITAKVGRFLFSTSAKRTFEQPKSTIDFDDILSSGKILICNFSKGLLGEDASVLFGTTILAKIQLATLRRAKVNPNKRQPFYFYVDEFQNFATTSFLQLLSEARKYKLFLTMAEQSTSQQIEDHMVDTILANVGTVICFRSASPADERFLLPLFNPYIEPGEISNLPSYNFYIRINAVDAHEPLSGKTVLLEDDGSETIATKVKEFSRNHNAIIYKNKKRSISDSLKQSGAGQITKNIPVIPVRGSVDG